jgi:CubicO group peptidase (beta-lactamase class C family)
MRFAIPIIIAVNLGTVQAANPTHPLDGLDEHIRKGMKLHGVTGMGLAIVKDGKVVLAKGYGLRELGKPEPVTEKTVFAIGSVSKSFTSATAAQLIHDGKLKWDDRIVKHLPTFQLGDPYLTQELRMRDLLAHRAGLERHDLVWYGNMTPRSDLMKLFPQMKVESALRTKFQYNNLMYMTAGETIGKIAGKSWDDYVAEKIFQPLGMSSANTSITKFSKSADIATPHVRKKGKPAPIEWLNVDNIGPAGSINASAEDMAKYVQYQLSQGKGPEKRLVKKDVFATMHEPQMLMGGGMAGLFSNGESKMSAYGLGWMISQYAGKTVVEHGGNIDGMTAEVGMIPEEKLGVVLLANADGSVLPGALMYDIFDRYLGRPVQPERVDGSSLITFLNAYAVTVAGVTFDESKRDKTIKPPKDWKAYVGTYQDDLYGTLKVYEEKDVLMAKWNRFVVKLDYWQHQTFRGIDPDNRWPTVGVSFALDADGRAAEVRTDGLSIEKVRFKRTK